MNCCTDDATEAAAVTAESPAWVPKVRPVVGAIRASSAREVVALESDWEFCSVDPGTDPADDGWVQIGTRTTVAGALRRSGKWSLASARATNLDEHDHWFRRVVELGPPRPGERVALELDGIASIAEVFWNGTRIATSNNMFRATHVDITDGVQTLNVLTIRCVSLEQHLTTTRIPRARWRTRLVADQRLRGVRTTLLGRIPAWTPPVVVVGPWRPVRIVRETQVSLVALAVRTEANRVRIEGTVDLPDGQEPTGGSVRIGTATAALVWMGQRFTCEVDTSQLDLWWPHTHGAPHRHRVSLTMRGNDLTAFAWSADFDLGYTGRRSIEVDRGADGHGFALRVNGVAVFCRGGSLMPLDVATLDDDPRALRRLLGWLCRAGVNMVRISGTTTTATTELLDLCDELGILVWQDLPLANFDYPAAVEFLDEVAAETTEFLGRSAFAPSLAVVCGGSEIQQQAAMLGLPSSTVCESAVLDRIAPIVAEYRADAVFVASSPTGGSQPFSNDSGISHYFGVGAYRRPLTDARHAHVRFAAECLAFANVPSSRAVAALLGDGETAPTHPLWKERVPRDRSTGWDFDDVRDHYARELFGVDPLELRWTDPERYLAVGRATSAAVMTQVFAEWRRPGSSCAGGLVWFLNDLWLGAGWGVVDADGAPKAALHGMAAALTPFALLAIDEGLNGLDLWACNDHAETERVTIEVQALQDGRDRVASGSVDVDVPARGGTRVRVDDVFGRFIDATAAYRFGPLGHDVIVARAKNQEGTVLGRTSYVPPGVVLQQHRDIGLRATAQWCGPHTLQVALTCERFARFTTVEVGGGTVWPDMFDLVPGDLRTVAIYLDPSTPVPERGYVSALNATGEITFAIPPRPEEDPSKVSP